MTKYGPLLGAAAIDDLDDVRVVEACKDARFLLEQANELLLREMLVPQELDRDAPAERDLLGLPDLGESSPREGPDDPQPLDLGNFEAFLDSLARISAPVPCFRHESHKGLSTMKTAA